MLFSKGCAALVACASLVSGQFVNPSKKTVVEVGKSIDIKWERAGLVAPLSISLIPGGTIIQESIIIQRVAGKFIHKDLETSRHTNKLISQHWKHWTPHLDCR